MFASILNCLLVWMVHGSEAQQQCDLHLLQHGADSTQALNLNACNGWCGANTYAWEDKCGWAACESCEICAVITLPTRRPTPAPTTKVEGCGGWCADDAAPWKIKCGWGGCYKCDACPEPTASPTPEPTESPTLLPTPEPTVAATDYEFGRRCTSAAYTADAALNCNGWRGLSKEKCWEKCATNAQAPNCPQKVCAAIASYNDGWCHLYESCPTTEASGGVVTRTKEPTQATTEEPTPAPTEVDTSVGDAERGEQCRNAGSDRKTVCKEGLVCVGYHWGHLGECKGPARDGEPCRDSTFVANKNYGEEITLLCGTGLQCEGYKYGQHLGVCKEE